jgi:hypothetical protein
MVQSDKLHKAKIRSIRAAVAGSPIVITPAAAEIPVHNFADWCERQKPAEIDAVILAWIVSHVPARTPADLS